MRYKLSTKFDDNCIVPRRTQWCVRTDRSGCNEAFVVRTWPRATGVHTAPCARGGGVSWSFLAMATEGNEGVDWLIRFLAVEAI
ncbi:hypothetical protein LXL04_031274 [Taraxacum kok-saghyz]